MSPWDNDQGAQDLLIEVVNAASLEVFRDRLDGVMSSLISCLVLWSATLPQVGVWN